MNRLKKALPLALTKELRIVQNTDEAGGMLVLQYFIALQKAVLHALQLVRRWMCIACAVFSSVLKLIRNSKEKRKS